MLFMSGNFYMNDKGLSVRRTGEPRMHVGFYSIELP